MTLEELVERFCGLGFVCHVDEMDGIRRLVTAKRASACENRVAAARGPWMWGPRGQWIAEVDGRGPFIEIKGDRIEVSFSVGIPRPADSYCRILGTVDELYEELLHFWFDPDSPMSTEEGFIGCAGRPADA